MALGARDSFLLTTMLRDPEIGKKAEGGENSRPALALATKRWFAVRA
jgi:hypothetical protein